VPPALTDNRAVAAEPRPVGLSLILGAVLVSLAAGYLLKLPCIGGDWSDGRPYNSLCYSDVVALFGSADRDRGLDENRVPYLDGENEYPVLSGVAMWAAAVPATSPTSFFHWTALLLTGSALATAWALYRMAGRQAMLFALAPTLALYAFVNWDLLAVALATLGTLAFLRAHEAGSGALLGLGAAAKLYPALLLIPFGIERFREGRRREAWTMVAAAAAVWVAVNLPFALAAPERWSEFYRFNTVRPPDFDSLWFLIGWHLGFEWNVGVVNSLSLVAFGAVASAVWITATRARPGFPTWTFGFPLLIAFLLTNKVYSPQYGLWLLPWFAMTLPDLRLFVAFQIAEVAVFVTRFQFFARLLDVGPGLPFGALEVALVLRAVVLVACVVAWVRRGADVPGLSLRPVVEAE
jgi:glycosyl transferase family 87